MSNHVLLRLATLLLAAFAIPIPTECRADFITTARWAGSVEATSGYVLDPANALGKPGSDNSEIGKNPPAPQAGSVRFGNFSIQQDLSPTALASALGVGVGQLATLDFIAFEFNSPGPFGVETSKWTFADGINTVVFNHVQNSPPPNIVEGQISLTNYNSFFGTSVSGLAIPFVLFELGPVNTQSAQFRVTIEADGGFSHTPDISGLGTLTTTPEPSSCILAGIGGLLILPLRRSFNRERVPS